MVKIKSQRIKCDGCSSIWYIESEATVTATLEQCPLCFAEEADKVAND